MSDSSISSLSTFSSSSGVSLEDLPEFVGPFRKVRTLRESSTGKTYLVDPEVPGAKPFVVKKIPRDVTAHGGANEILATVAVQKFAGDNVVGCLGVSQDEKFFYLTMEHCQKGELCSVLQRFRHLVNEVTLRAWALQLLTGVKDLHDHGVCHRNISLESVFVCEDGSLRLSDFSQAMRVPEGTLITPGKSMLPGKEGYRAPELYRGQPYSGTGVDAFACGVIIYALAIGSQGRLKYPIERYLPRYLFSADLSNLACHMKSLGVQVSSGLILFLEALLEPNAAQRSTVEEALAHPWLQKPAWPNAARDLTSVGRACREEAKSQTLSDVTNMKYDQLMGG
jgi:serine/threonine protein kinase